MKHFKYRKVNIGKFQLKTQKSVSSLLLKIHNYIELIYL